MSDDLHARVARNERDIEALQRALAATVTEISGKLDKLIEAVNVSKTTTSVNDVTRASEIKEIRGKLCPYPGSCMENEEQIKVLQVRVGALHDMVQQGKGAWKAIATIAGLVSATITISAMLIKQWLTGGH